MNYSTFQQVHEHKYTVHEPGHKNSNKDAVHVLISSRTKHKLKAVHEHTVHEVRDIRN